MNSPYDPNDFWSCEPTSTSSSSSRRETSSASFVSAPPAEARRVYNGICIVGCDPACGKTVLMTGLAGVFSDQGGTVRAIKPITYARKEKSAPEFSFISCITGTEIDYSRFHLSFPPVLTEAEWESAILDATTSDAITLIELPAGVATPLSLERDNDGLLTHEWRTTSDLISEIGYPVLLVARHGPDAFEKLNLSLSYLNARGVPVVAIATVETSPLEARFMEQHIPKDDFQLFMIAGTRVPYLGCLKFSPSINVERLSQGNLKRNTEDSLDLLLLRRSLNLPV